MMTSKVEYFNFLRRSLVKVWFYTHEGGSEINRPDHVSAINLITCPMNF